MREFEKWWNKIEEYCHNPSGQFDKKDGEWAWRAALEWASGAGKDGNCGMCYTKSVIEEELESLNQQSNNQP